MRTAPCWAEKVTPLDRVGIYVPGGKAAYPSSVLMNAIPAPVAGVTEIIMVVPTPKGEKNPLVLAAAYIAGVTRGFTIGGAQAVAALAYGTAAVPKVDKITGPGDAYVASAKKRVFGHVGIDMIAGPSEILVLADGTTPRMGGHGFVQPGRARRAGPIHPAVPRCRLHRRRAARNRPPAARNAPRGHHRQIAQRPWGLDPHAQHGRGLRHL